MKKVLTNIGKILFHRVGIVAVLIIAQLLLYFWMLAAAIDAAPIYGALMVALSAATVLWIVTRRNNPGYQIGWIIIVLVLMPLGSAAYLLLGGNRLSRFNQRRLRTMENQMRRYLQPECGRSDSLAELMGEDAGCMAHYLEQTMYCPVYGNTRTKYYPLGDAALQDILDALRQAKHYIFVEYFIIEEGTFWGSVLKVLQEKAQSGVEVRVIYDDIGSIVKLPYDYPNTLEAMGIHCRVFNRFVPVVSMRQNNRDHRKYLIVDGYTAFTGGINMADEYINVKRVFGHWKDAAIRLEGDAVWSMAVSFLAMWDFTVSEREQFQNFRPLPSCGNTQGYVQPYHDCPWDNEPVGQTVYLNLIYRAKRYIYITTPYLVLDYSLTTGLVAAAKSGVDVRIITPHIPDKKYVFELTRSYYCELLEAGVQIFEYAPGFIHSKNFVVDDKFATVGTVNLDYRSMFLHFENGVLLYGTPSVEDIRDDFLETQTKSLMVTMADCNAVPWPRRAMRSALRVLAPLL